ncbi:MAG: hypothetical protein AB7I27_14660 [Bacteriovoracaceae bacterium]
MKLLFSFLISLTSFGVSATAIGVGSYAVYEIKQDGQVISTLRKEVTKVDLKSNQMTVTSLIKASGEKDQVEKEIILINENRSKEELLNDLNKCKRPDSLAVIKVKAGSFATCKTVVKDNLLEVYNGVVPFGVVKKVVRDGITAELIEYKFK